MQNDLKTAPLAVATTEGGVEVEGVISLNRLERLRHNVAQLNKRFQAHGLEPIEVLVGRRRLERFMNQREGIVRDLWVAAVTLRGPAYRLGSYRLLASIHHDSEPITFQAFGNESMIPAAYRRAESRCDHCQTARRRSTTFILRDRTDTYLQVGSTCLEEFTGVSPVLALAATSAFTEFNALVKAELGWDDGERDMHVSPTLPLATYLESVAHVFRQHGWVSRTTAKDAAERGLVLGATSDLAFAHFKKRAELQDYGKDVGGLLNPGDHDLAAQALDFVRAAYPMSDDNPVDDFTANLTSIAHSINVEEALIGTAAYILRAHQKAALDKASKDSPSEWVGVASESLELEISVLAVTPVPGVYGVKHIHKMQDGDHNELVWYCSGKPLAPGLRARVKATVKEHSEYRGVKQTVVTRVKVCAAPTQPST